MTAFAIRTARTGARDLAMGRVNVFLGANGTGKSRLLRELQGRSAEFLPNYTVVYIEGGRAIQMQDSLELNRSNFDQYRTLERALNTYRGKRTQNLATRVFDALMTLERIGQESKNEHSDAVEQWLSSGSIGECPRRKQPPIERVFEMFCEIFPRIQLSLDPKSRRLICIKDSNQYGPTQLSDGEKQVLSILADMVELSEPRSLLLVDEPELNLNPQLATRLWDTIEEILPESRFIYATHSVSFAMRSGVDRVVVLSSVSENTQAVDGLADLNPDDLQALLGNIPAILSASSAILVEGDQRSFDAIFYKWLVADRDFEAVPLGGADDVMAVLRREGVWSALSANLSLFGIIDRDYKPDERLTDGLPKNCIVLKLHEAESYLCHPKILIDIAHALGTADPMPSEQTVTDVIRDFFEEEKLRICARRVFARSQLRIGVSLHKHIVSQIQDYGALESLILNEARKELSRATAKLEDDEVKKLIKSEWDRLEHTLSKGSIEDLLCLAPGKELLRRLAPMVGCKDSKSVARAARRHIAIDSAPMIASLRQQIVEKLQSHAG